MKLRYTDGGKKEAGYKGRSGDCVSRSISLATGVEYKKVLKELQKRQKQWGRSEGYSVCAAKNGVYAPVYFSWLEELGFRRVFLCSSWDMIPKIGTFVVQTHRHLSCVIDSIIHDTFDPSNKEIMTVWEAPEAIVLEDEVPVEVQSFISLMETAGLEVKVWKDGVSYWNECAQLMWMENQGYWRIQFIGADSPLFATFPTSAFRKKQTPYTDFNSAFSKTYLETHIKNFISQQ